MGSSLAFRWRLRTLAAIPTTARALTFVRICSPCIGGCFKTRSSAQTVHPAGSDITSLIAAASDRDVECASTGPLEELQQQRIRQINSADCFVGPGDILQSTAADLPEINKLNARVNGQGEITLPLLRELNVADLTKQDAAQLTEQKARAAYIRGIQGFMYSPNILPVAM